MNKLFVALAAASALTAASALPASATAINDGDYFPEVNGVTWGDFYQDEYADGFNVDDAYTDDQNDAFDGAGYFEWKDVSSDSWSDYVACFDSGLDAATDGTGDYILTCAPDTDIFDGIDSQVAGRLYSEGDMFRFEYTITNNSDADFEFGWYSETQYGCGIEDDNETTDLARGFDIQTYDSSCISQDYAQGVAFGKAGAASYPDTVDALDIADDEAIVYGPAENNVVLAPGDSATIVIFVFHQMDGSDNGYPSDDYGFLTGWADDAFASWTADPRTARGIADDVFVANWMTEAPGATSDDNLASTGTDITGALALGGSALVAGAVAMIVRRRRTV